MNTLTIVILVACATAAFASVLPGAPGGAEAGAPLAPVSGEELLQGEEARWRGGGGGGYYRGGGWGGYNRGGGWGGYHGGGGGGGHYHRRGWGY